MGAPDKRPEEENARPGSKLARVDFLGAVVLALLILAFLFPMELGGVKIPWTHPLIPTLLGSAGLLLILFVTVEKRWAKEPIIPISLFKRKNAVASFAIMALQTGAQLGVSHEHPIWLLISWQAC